MTEGGRNLRKCWHMMRSFPEKSISSQSAFRLANCFPAGAANDTEFNTASTFNKLLATAAHVCAVHVASCHAKF